MKGIQFVKFLTSVYDRLRRYREERAFAALGRSTYAASRSSAIVGSEPVVTVNFLCEEFFHPDLRGYGGFGLTVKNIAEHFNAAEEAPYRVRLAFPQGTQLVRAPEVRRFHETDVILRPATPRTHVPSFTGYHHLLNRQGRQVFLSIDWYPSYLYPLHALSATPLIIWIHDPRDRDEWQRIGQVPGELEFRGLRHPHELHGLADEKASSMRRLFNLQKSCPRMIAFATTAMTLLERARATYQLPDLQAHWLPNPIALPDVPSIEYSEKPTLLYLGRLDPVKRPWIVFELARRHPGIDFVIAGQSHAPDLFRQWKERYDGLPNLKLLGHVDAVEKDRLLRSCWGILNTSVHEAEPVSFLEAFSYGKCVVSCHDPDQEVSRFGYFVGEVNGEGLDEDSLRRFGDGINQLVSRADQRLEKGTAGMAEMKKHHTFKRFEERLSEIIEIERLHR